MRRLPPGWRVGARVAGREPTSAHVDGRGRSSAAAGRVPARLRDLPARPVRPRRDVERRRAAAEGLQADEIIGRHFSRSIPEEDVAAGLPERILEAARADGPPRGRRLAGPQGRLAVLGRRRDHRAARRGRHARRLRQGDARPHEPPARDRAAAGAARGAADGQRRARAVPAAGHERARLRDLHARPDGPHPDLERRAPSASRATAPTRSSAGTSSSSTPPEARARRHPDHELEVAAREGRFEEEGWRVRKDGTRFWANVVITALRDARGGARRLRQGHARPDRAPPGAAAARGVRAPGARREAERQRRRSAALERVARAIVARLDLEEILQTAIDAAIELTGARVFDRLAGTLRARLHRAGRRGSDHAAEGATGRSYLASRSAWPTARSPAACCFGHPEAGVFDAEASRSGAEHRVRGGGGDRQRAAAGGRASGDRRARGRAAPARPGRHRAAAEPAAARPAAASRGSSSERTITRAPSWSAVTSTTCSRSARTRGASCLGDVCGSGPEAASQTALTRHTVRTAAMFDTDARDRHARPQPRAAALEHGRASPPRSSCAWTSPPSAARSAPRSRQAAIRPPSSAAPTARSRNRRRPGSCSASRTSRSRRCTSPTTELAAGDTLVLYTDGLTEARRAGVLFDVEGVEATLDALSGEAPSDIANGARRRRARARRRAGERRHRDRRHPRRRSSQPAVRLNASTHTSSSPRPSSSRARASASGRAPASTAASRRSRPASMLSPRRSTRPSV